MLVVLHNCNLTDSAHISEKIIGCYKQQTHFSPYHMFGEGGRGKCSRQTIHSLVSLSGLLGWLYMNRFMDVMTS